VSKEKRRDIYRAVVGKVEGHNPLGRHRCKWDNSFRIDLRDIYSEGLELAQIKDTLQALFNKIIHFQILYSAVSYEHFIYKTPRCSVYYCDTGNYRHLVPYVV
jgi:hypothetical protein